MRRMLLTLTLLTIFSGNAFAQENNSRGFCRIGVGYVNFEHSSFIGDPEYDGHIHFHQAAIITNFALGYGTDKFRVLVFFDPAIVDGVRGASIISVGAKGEIGVPWLKWLKVGGGVMHSYNYTKLSAD